MVERGEVWWTDFGGQAGSSRGYHRPTVVISSDRFNSSRIDTVVVAAITSNTRLSLLPGNVMLPDDLLAKPSVVNVTALFTVYRKQLVDHIADLPKLETASIDDGLRLVLNL